MAAAAQPSGGPYGPVDQRYEVPKAAHVYYVAPDGKAESPGTALEQPTTLAAAIDKVVSGDAIVMRGGTYRTGGLLLNQGVTIQPYLNERPVVKGTEVATKWEALRGNVWRTSWKRLFPAAPLGWWQRNREGMRTPLHRFNNDMVFIDGELLKSAGWEGELERPLVLCRLHGRLGLPRHESGKPPGGDHGLGQCAGAHQRRGPRQEERP